MFIHPFNKYLLGTRVLKAEGSILNLKETVTAQFLKKKKKKKNYVFVFIYLTEPGLSCGMQDLEFWYVNCQLWHMGSSSLTRG